MAKWGSVKTNSFGDRFTFTDYAAVLDLKEAAKNKWFRIRFVGELLPTRQLWFATKSEKDGGVNNWPRLVESFDPKTEEYVKLPKGQRDYYKDFAEANGKHPSVSFWANVINREKQDARPAKSKSVPTPAERKTGFKDIASKTYTPVEVTFLNAQLAEQIQRLMESNMRRGPDGKRQVYPPDHPEFGFDVEVYYDAKTTNPQKWSVRIPDEDSDGGKGKVKLTPEEVDYLVWDLESIYDAQIAAQKSRSALEDIASSLPRFVFTDRKTGAKVKTVVPEWLKEALGTASRQDDEDEDAEDEGGRGRPKKKGGKKKPPASYDEDEDEDIFGDDEDEDIFGDDEDEDEDEDAPPPRSKSRGASSKGNKRPVKRPDPDEDEDEDETDEDLDDEDDDEEDAPPPRPKKKAKPGAKVTAKGGKSGMKRPASSSRRASRNDDYEDDIPF